MDISKSLRLNIELVRIDKLLFAEGSCRIIISIDPKKLDLVLTLLHEHNKNVNKIAEFNFDRKKILKKLNK